jgi:hypothetical protein
MGRRKRGASNVEEAAKLSLPELEQRIAYADWRYNGSGLKSALRKDAFDHLVWLEAQREKLHGVPAPNRRAHRRST